jgi:dihydrofolate reductase
MLFHVVAMANRRVIGKNNRLPWHFPSDLKHFKQLTTGGTILMGRKTFASIGKPLPERINFVVSRSAKQGGDNPRFFQSIEEALRSVATKDCYVIGGAEIYRQTMDQIDGIYLTRIHADYEGDAFYPEIPSFFRETSRTKLQENPLIEVLFYERVSLPEAA